MKTTLILFGLIFALCQSALAGGDSFLIKIVSLTPKDDGEYRMEFVQHGAPYGKALEEGAKRVVLHLRYEESIFGEGTSYTSRQKYEAAIAFLNDQAEKKEKGLFGVMAQGYLPIKGKKDEYQSNGLAIMEQADGKMAVFSFANKI